MLFVELLSRIILVSYKENSIPDDCPLEND